MDDIELRSVQLQFSNGRGSLSGNCDLRRIVTDKGEVLVAVQGDITKPAILTYHDLGLNCMILSFSSYKHTDFIATTRLLLFGIIVIFTMICRCNKFRWVLQLSNDASALREFLRVSRNRAGARRRSAEFT